MQAVAVNPFWRGDPSRSRATGGTGLGLSVVRDIAAAHGGHLELANRSGGGRLSQSICSENRLYHAKQR
ncbi:sensor histidine kinase [Rhizobium sp. NZLR1b]|nr:MULTISPECIES: sensor histidine kinase [unclassified Rhizobium]